VTIERPNEVRATNISDIPIRCDFVYLVAVADVFTQRVLSHRVSIMMASGFRKEALNVDIIAALVGPRSPVAPTKSNRPVFSKPR